MNARHTYIAGAIVIVLCGWVISAFGVEFIKEKVAKVDDNAERVAIIEHDLMQHKAEDERRWEDSREFDAEVKADLKTLLREVSELNAYVKNFKVNEDE